MSSLTTSSLLATRTPPVPLFPSSFPGTPTTTTSGSSATSSDNTEPSLTSSAALYLYTFLATLVLLLAVSSAIVIRSLILRRRHQRIVEEAIRAGTWLPHQSYDPRGSRRRRDIGKKPKLWEAWLRSGDEESSADGKCAWDDIMPVYAAHIKSAPKPPSPRPEPAQIRSDAPSRTMRLLRPFRTPFSPAPTTSSPIVASTPVPSSPSRSAPPAVSIAVLIAMPTPQHAREMDGPPVVELGVVDVPLQDMSPMGGQP
ncbi:hypothetical protein DEU56DRAFT_792494 [Suillus clintonianus]|uniref:uncharacterized protein n=1 Tax=Suillus clintonianus TaxID=1904413 RepID=UPI001B86E8BD|nr:uncharacterized protein DEU56DRAFT_792494 [Suillus clintonianus]KAG2143737.1 hypothetical protein DEU56DRAFT_792494 [Suillus clintonianus]